METVIDQMVVRLMGDGSDYQKMLSQAQSATSQAAQQVEQASKKIEGFSSGLQGFAGAATSALAMIGIGGGLKQMFGAFAEAETVSIRLNAVLQANGRNAEATRSQYNAFANEIQRLTILDDDATLALLNQAESFELTGRAAQDAVKNAVSLAAITGGSAESMIRLTAALAKGDVERAMQMARMVPQLRGITKESEFVAKAQQLMAAGWSTAQAEAGSASGQLKQLSNAFGNLMEDMGEIVAKAVKPFVSWLQRVVAAFQALGPEVKTLIVGLVGLLGAVTALGPAVYIFKAMAGPIAAMGTSVVGLLNPLKLLSLALGGISTALGVVRAAAATAFGPIGIGIAAVTAALGVFVKQSGGTSNAFTRIKNIALDAWEGIKTKFSEFMEWIEPIVGDLVDFFEAAWDFIIEGVEALWDVVKDVFKSIGDFIGATWLSASDGATINWETIRETIRTVIQFCTFTLRNFGQVAGYVWTAIKLGAVTAFDFVRDAFVVAGATLVGVVRAVEKTFVALWANIMAGAERAINYVRAGWEGLKAAAEAVVNLRSPMAAFRQAQQAELARLTAASRNQFQNMGSAAAAGFNLGFEGTVEALGGVGQSRVQQQLRREFQEQGAALGVSFEEFQRRRREATAAAGAIDDPTNQDNPMAPVLAAAKQVNKEVEKFDAALRHSAEGTARITAYMERMRPTSTASTPGATPQATSAALSRPQAPQVNMPQAPPRPQAPSPSVPQVPIPQLPQLPTSVFDGIRESAYRAWRSIFESLPRPENLPQVQAPNLPQAQTQAPVPVVLQPQQQAPQQTAQNNTMVVALLTSINQHLDEIKRKPGLLNLELGGIA